MTRPPTTISNLLHRLPPTAPGAAWVAAALTLSAPGCGRNLDVASSGTTTGAGSSTTIGWDSATVADTGWVSTTSWDTTGWDDTGWASDTAGIEDWGDDGTCANGVADADETDVDCGGPLCEPCFVGRTCAVDSDCKSGLCEGGVCACNPWSEPIATGGQDLLSGIVVSDGAVVLAGGDSTGEVQGQPPAGGRDLLLTRRPPTAPGSTVFQSGSGGIDALFALAIRWPTDSSTYLVGATDGALGDSPPAGGMDAFTAFTFGNLHVWTLQLGTALDDRAADVAARPDDLGLVVVGDWHDDLGAQQDPTRSAAFVASVSPDGALEWQRLINSGEPDFGRAVALTPGGEIVVVGDTLGQAGDDPAAGGQDLFVARYPTDGPPLWIRQLGTPSWDAAHDVAVDDLGDIYVLAQSSGALMGAPNAGGRDVFLIKLDASGAELWTRSLGTSTNDYGAALELHPDGGVVIAGRVLKSLDGQPAFGSWDIFLSRFDADGAKLWTRQLGTAGDDRATDLAIHPTEGLYLSATSDADLAGPNQGDLDGAIVHLCE